MAWGEDANGEEWKGAKIDVDYQEKISLKYGSITQN